MTYDSELDTMADNRFREVCVVAMDAMTHARVPGVAIGIWHENKEYVAGLGVTNVEHPLQVTGETLFQVGSITKTFVATAIMRLVEAGRVGLDVPVRTWLPELCLADEAVAAQVTLRHLLTHTGGWVGDYFNDFGWGDDALARMVDRLAGLPQLTPLGALWSYNNAGFYLAGRVIEVVTAQSFEVALKRLVLDPLGLARSFFFPHDVITHRFAVGHEVVGGQPRVARPWQVGRAVHPAGGLVSNVHDLLAYARFHMGDGTVPGGARLLARESLALMQSPLIAASGPNMMGLSWFVSNFGGVKVIRHGGATKGQTAELRLVPLAKFAIAVFTNGDEGNTVYNRAAAAALKRFLGLVVPEPVLLDLPKEKLAEYVGRYGSALAENEITWREGGLVLQVKPKGGFPTPDAPPEPAPPPVRIAFYDVDKIVALDDPMKDARGEFVRHPDGALAWFRMGSRLNARLA